MYDNSTIKLVSWNYLKLHEVMKLLEMYFFLKETPRATKNHPMCKHICTLKHLHQKSFVPLPSPISHFQFSLQKPNMLFFQKDSSSTTPMWKWTYSLVPGTSINVSKHESFEHQEVWGISKFWCFKIRRVFNRYISFASEKHGEFEAGGNNRFPAIWKQIHWRSGQCRCVVEQHPGVSWRNGTPEEMMNTEFWRRFFWWSLTFFIIVVVVVVAVVILHVNVTSRSFCEKGRGNTFKRPPFFLKLIYWDHPPPRIPVTTRIIIFSVGGIPSKTFLLPLLLGRVWHPNSYNSAFKIGNLTKPHVTHVSSTCFKCYDNALLLVAGNHLKKPVVWEFSPMANLRVFFWGNSRLVECEAITIQMLSLYMYPRMYLRVKKKTWNNKKSLCATAMELWHLRVLNLVYIWSILIIIWGVNSLPVTVTFQGSQVENPPLASRAIASWGVSYCQFRSENFHVEAEIRTFKNGHVNSMNFIFFHTRPSPNGSKPLLHSAFWGGWIRNKHPPKKRKTATKNQSKKKPPTRKHFKSWGQELPTSVVFSSRVVGYHPPWPSCYALFVVSRVVNLASRYWFQPTPRALFRWRQIHQT